MPGKTKTKTKTKAGSSPGSPRRHHAKHVKHLHIQRVSWFSALAVGLLVIQLASGLEATRAQQPQVLAYATSVSVDGLLSTTNQARAANGLGALALSSKLNTAAQGKGNHMIAHNYWSHNAPDGTTPWYWFNYAGYKYARAGENLAYGFDSSGQIIDAWMNSAGHRANILGDYADVGFGISNGSAYQGGEFTVVVAHYGKPAYTAPPPAPKPTPTPQVVQATPQPTPTPTPAPEPTPVPEEPAQQPAAPAPTTEQPSDSATTPVSEESKKVSNLETLVGGQAAWAVYASLGLVGMTSLGFASTHWQLVRRGWRESKHFILVHPALDTAVITAVVAIVLTSAAGFIK